MRFEGSGLNPGIKQEGCKWDGCVETGRGHMSRGAERAAHKRFGFGEGEGRPTTFDHFIKAVEKKF